MTFRISEFDPKCPYEGAHFAHFCHYSLHPVRPELMRPRKVTPYDLLKRDWRPDVPGLLDVTVKDIRAMKLDELRAVAKRAGLHPSWHGHTRKKELIDAVVARRKEHATFAKAVKSHGREKALQRGREEIEHAAHHGKSSSRGPTGPSAEGDANGWLGI